jgi:hypothetical protein
MPTITIGANTFEVYDTLANVDTYFAGAMPDNQWVCSTNDQKLRAMVTATRMFESIRWQGAKTSDAQPIAWPRTGVIDRYGLAVSSSVIPTALLFGFYEYVLQLLVDSTIVDSVSTLDNIKRVKAGAVEAEFFKSTNPVTIFPVSVNRWVGQFQSGGVVVGLVSGDDEESYFATGSDLYGKSEGFA